MNKRNLKVIGVGGFARSGKDTFCAVASKILKASGYDVMKLAFADELKKQVQKMLQENMFDLDVWTDNSEQKAKIRPLLVWWGCARRDLGDGQYWIDELDYLLQGYNDVGDCHNTVFLVSDVRFPNEVKWVQDRWGGWVVHLKKYSVRGGSQYDSFTGKEIGFREWKQYDDAPNEEEAKQDPLIQQLVNDKLELENVIEREARLGNKITVADLPDNMYLNEEIRLCLAKVPFLTIQKS